jgi:hypothetical protein
MAVKVKFQGEARPPDPGLWKLVAEAVLRGQDGLLLVRRTNAGWKVAIVGTDPDVALRHPHADGDYETEVRQALRAAGVDVVNS